MEPRFDKANTQIKGAGLVCYLCFLNSLLHLSFFVCAGTLSVYLIRAGKRAGPFCQEQLRKPKEKSKNKNEVKRLGGWGFIIIIQPDLVRRVAESLALLTAHQKDGLTISQSRVRVCSPFASPALDKSRNNLCRERCLAREHGLESSALIFSFCSVMSLCWYWPLETLATSTIFFQERMLIVALRVYLWSLADCGR